MLIQDTTDTDVKKVLALHLQPVEFDTKYDSDSDFDYRQKPPRYIKFWVELLRSKFKRSTQKLSSMLTDFDLDLKVDIKIEL